MVVFTKHGLRLKVLSIPITLPFGPVQLDFISSSCLSEYAITLGGVFGVRNISYTFFPFWHMFRTQSISSAILRSGNFSLSILLVSRYTLSLICMAQGALTESFSIIC